MKRFEIPLAKPKLVRDYHLVNNYNSNFPLWSQLTNVIQSLFVTENIELQVSLTNNYEYFNSNFYYHAEDGERIEIDNRIIWENETQDYKLIKYQFMVRKLKKIKDSHREFLLEFHLNSIPTELGNSNPESTCVICFDENERITTYIVPCNHKAFCGPCLQRILLMNMSCPLCRAKIENIKWDNKLIELIK